MDNLTSSEKNRCISNESKDDSTIICERNKDIFQTQNQSISQFQFQTHSESPILSQTQKQSQMKSIYQGLSKNENNGNNERRILAVNEKHRGKI